VDDAWINCPHCGLKHRPRAVSLCPRCGRTTSTTRASATAIPVVPPVARASVTAIPTVVPAPAPRPAPASISAPPPPEVNQDRVPTVEVDYITLDSLEDPVPVRRVVVPSDEPEPQKQTAAPSMNVLPLVGGILLINAVLHLFEFLFLPSVSTEPSLRAAQLAGTLIGVGIDAMLGISFLRGQSHYRTFAFVRLLVGLFLFGGMSFYQAQYLFTLVVLAFSIGVMVLVWTKPSAFMAGVSLTAVMLGVGVEVIGFVRLSQAQPLLERARIALRPDLEGAPLRGDDTIVGDRYSYKLHVPSQGWYRRKAEAARNGDSSVDTWLSHPDHNGNLVVSVRSWSEANATNLREARDGALQSLKTQYPGFLVADTSDDGIGPKVPTVASVSGSVDKEGKPYRYEVSVYRLGGTLMQVTAFAPSKTFDTLNLRGATQAFQPE
jgi:membrane protein implicated in regulation of membrane protease activity